MPKINQLTPATSLANTDLIITDTNTGSNTRNIQYANLRTQIQNESASVFAAHGEIASDQQVATAVGNWLDANVTPTGSAVAIDDTLLISGAAADAQATGKMIVINGTSAASTRVNITTSDTDVELAEMSDVNELKNANAYNILSGHINPGSNQTINGITFSWNNNVCSISGTASATAYYYFGDKFDIPDGYKSGDTLYGKFQDSETGVLMLVVFYDTNGQYIQNQDALIATEKTFTIPANASKMRIGLVVRNGTSFSSPVSIDFYSIRALTAPSNSDLIKIINEGGLISAQDFIKQISGISGVSITTDSYTDEMIVNLSSTTYTKTWVSIDIACAPMTCYLLEFYGKCSFVDYSSDASRGALLMIEFFDKNGAQIGVKYNAEILGADSRRYHRCGAVSPLGAKTVRLRVASRSNCTAELANVSLRPVPGYQGRSGKGVQIDAHLGCIMTAPKNTMPAFEQAKIAGYNTCICNVKFTSDGVPVVIHDQTIDATSNGSGQVSSYTYEQLLTYDFGSWFNAAYTGTKIPTLEEVLTFLSVNGIRPAISLHGDQSNAQLDIVAELFARHSAGDCVIKSFSYNTIRYMYSKLGKAAAYVWDVDGTIPESDMIEFKTDFPDVTICIESIPSYVTQESVNMAHSHGIQRSVYDLVDTAQLRKYLLMGIDRVCMDFFSDVVTPVM